MGKGLYILFLGDHESDLVREAPPQVDHAVDPLECCIAPVPVVALEALGDELVVVANAIALVFNALEGAAVE